jgi:hypothetical protein
LGALFKRFLASNPVELRLVRIWYAHGGGLGFLSWESTWRTLPFSVRCWYGRLAYNRWW